MLRLTDQDILKYCCELRRMKNLRSLEIRNSRLTVLGFKALANCLPNLKSLDLRNSNVDN
jgi:hypothetical protein